MQFDRLKRREFFTVIGGAVAWPIAARALRIAAPAQVSNWHFSGIASCDGMSAPGGS
jgi:hypothetical protein